jgi:hypothetical protein
VFYIPRVTTFALGALLASAADDAAPDTATGFEPPDDTILAEAVFVGTVLDVWEAGNRWIARFAVECAGLGTRVGEIVGVTPAAGDGSGPPCMHAGERWMIVTRRVRTLP